MHILERSKIFDYIPIVSFVKAITSKDRALVKIASQALQQEGEPPIKIEKVHTYSILRSDSILRKVVMSVPIIGNLIILGADSYASARVQSLQNAVSEKDVGSPEERKKIHANMLKEAVKWGDANSAGKLFLLAKGSKQLIYWLKKEVELGDFRAAQTLGNTLLENKRVSEAEKVFDLIGMAPYTKLLLANYYYRTKNPDDEKRAIELDSQIEKSNESNVQLQLALAILNGAENGRKIDFTRAERLFENVFAHSPDITLGDDLDGFIATYWDSTQARKIFTPLADKGHARACVWLGILAERRDKNIQLAMQWYERAGKEGFSDGWRRLGNVYRQGYKDIVKENIPQATLYYIKAAIAGNERALNQLKSVNGDLHLKALDNVSAAKEKEILERELARMEKLPK